MHTEKHHNAASSKPKHGRTKEKETHKTHAEQYIRAYLFLKELRDEIFKAEFSRP